MIGGKVVGKKMPEYLEVKGEKIYHRIKDENRVEISS